MSLHNLLTTSSAGKSSLLAPAGGHSGEHVPTSGGDGLPRHTPDTHQQHGSHLTADAAVSSSSSPISTPARKAQAHSSPLVISRSRSPSPDGHLREAMKQDAAAGGGSVSDRPPSPFAERGGSSPPRGRSPSTTLSRSPTAQVISAVARGVSAVAGRAASGTISGPAQSDPAAMWKVVRPSFFFSLGVDILLSTTIGQYIPHPDIFPFSEMAHSFFYGVEGSHSKWCSS